MNASWGSPVLIVFALGLTGCGSTTNSAAVTDTDSPVTKVAAASTATTEDALPHVVAYKSPSCGCCEMWVKHMRDSGFPVEVKSVEDLGGVKTDAGVPAGKASCHTSKVGGYFVEGHVPAEDIKRLLTEKPDAKGLVVPGMVLGSPGMEQAGVSQPYDVLLVNRDGTTTVFAHHGG